MDGRNIEPRTVLWAMAEVAWEDANGTSLRAPATLEDTSLSGACIRVPRPFGIGSRVTVKWHREQFSAVARNCRKDGKDFLLGVRRENDVIHPPTAQEAKPTSRSDSNVKLGGTSSKVEHSANSPPPNLRRWIEHPGASPAAERKPMPQKTFLTQFWRRPPDGDAPPKSTSTEAPVNKPTTRPMESPSRPQGDLLAYEDIYRAAGILSPGSGYGIHKVVDMLNSERIRDLSKDVKRASVLMALDAAGISADDLLTDATRRQNALNSYEAAQRKQLEDFEARKAQENARVEEELEKIRAHYAQRIQNNLDQVAKEKDALHNWQMAMQHESQRIAEVIELCGKPMANSKAMSATATAAGASAGSLVSPDSNHALRAGSTPND